MAERRPYCVVATLDGTNARGPYRIPHGSKGFALNPRTMTVDVLFAFTREDAVSEARGCMLMDGQTFELALQGDDVLGETSLWLYAAAAVVVDVMWW